MREIGAGHENMLTRQEQALRGRRDDLWCEWTGTGGTFTIHRNGGFPIFPMTREESDWVRSVIQRVYGAGAHAA